MPTCFGVSSGLSSSKPSTSNQQNIKNTDVNFKQGRLGDFRVYCSSQNDIRPANRGEAKVRMTAKELVSVRSLLRELEITKNPYQDSTIKSNNCGIPYFPLK
ncbi:hypothetical protein LU604_18495 [Erwinia tracheiphila]|uniref:hypothetical protein n=1 Tax=Erwinia tracheiphila TaxID=65700 RepID=UPI001F1B2A29|nr:hypothetical protein [Erwinia tracheiphila]UIA82498.1 hypothetical protein LU604_18495 [Erwinia tracheiphila]UIA91088.1 hypothetical protein LU632_18030 [Erwinia tracheiphila]